MAARGDWQTRSLCLSAVGRIVRADPFAHRIHPFRHWIARRVPFLRKRFPSGGYHGKYVRNYIANALADRSWIVRTAAALALGECRARSTVNALRPLLGGPYRAERIAAAAAIVSLGEPVPYRSSLLDGAAPAPASIGDDTRSVEFLALLAASHAEILTGWRRIEGEEAFSATTACAWAEFLAGSTSEERNRGVEAEIRRHADAAADTYLLAKPFSQINSRQDSRLLQSFLAAADQLRVPANGRILDLGAGSGWVSELLAKRGYRPISLDLSFALLTLGRCRFERERLTPRLAVSDMTRLPVAAGSIDAVFVMDALHHVPSIADVFHEAYRVLVDGGQFILAEPGEGHADSEKARSERLVHGVQEREVHLFEAVDRGREAGFTDIRVVLDAPPVTMTPEAIRQATKVSADEWIVHSEDQPAAFPEFLLQSAFCRPIIVFGKGRRPVDSRLPQRLQAEIAPRLVRRGAQVQGTATVRNVGDTRWLGGGEAVGHVRLGIQLLTSDHHMVDVEFARARLPADVPPGAAVEVDVNVTLPDADVRYVLKLDLVDEGICWFEDVGSRVVYVPV